MSVVKKIMHEVEIFRDINMAYDSLKEHIFSDMNRKLHVPYSHMHPRESLYVFVTRPDLDKP